MMRTEALSAWCTPVLPRRCRLRLVFFLVRMWRRYAWPRLMPPPARLRKRFAAARLVFNLGTISPFLIYCRVPAMAAGLRGPGQLLLLDAGRSFRRNLGRSFLGRRCRLLLHCRLEPRLRDGV